jgi:hypothetical protein
LLLQLLVFSLTILLIVVDILRFIPNRVLKPLGRIYLFAYLCSRLSGWLPSAD